MIDGANEGRQLHLDADLCLQQSFSQLVMKNIHSLKFAGIVPPSWNNISGFRANITFLKSNCYAEQTHCPPGLEKENYWNTNTRDCLQLIFLPVLVLVPKRFLLLLLAQESWGVSASADLAPYFHIGQISIL